MPHARISRDFLRREPRSGVAVVIDVLRFSTTLCALLRAGRRRIRVARDPEGLASVRDLDCADVFSEAPFRGPGRRFDNSPHQASQSRGNRPVYVTTATGSKAVFAARGADVVLIACFANFDAVLRLLSRTRRRVQLLPAGVLEDELCAGALREALAGDRLAAEKALARLRQGPRMAQFLRSTPRHGDKDLALCLTLNSLPVVPEAVFCPSDPAIARVRRAARS
ncbi:MAG: 2-phosphosulfolactate phosphatase [Elusimicrobiota bacterium]